MGVGAVEEVVEVVESVGRDDATCRKNSSMYCKEVGSYCEG